MPGPAYEQMIRSLERGTCIVQRTLSDYPHPFVAKIDYVAPYRGDPPEYDSHPFVPDKRLNELSGLSDALLRRIDEARATSLRQRKRAKSGLSEPARNLIEQAAKAPYTPVARLFERIGNIHFTAQKRVRAELEDAKLAEFKEVRISSLNVLLTWLQPLAWQLVDRKPPQLVGRGGIEHRHFAFWLESCGKRQGIKARRELIAPGTSHPMDVAWFVNGSIHGFEICVTCTANIVSHLQACLRESDDVAQVTILTPVRKWHKAIQESVHGEPTLWPVRDRIKFDVIEPYMKELFAT